MGAHVSTLGCPWLKEKPKGKLYNVGDQSLFHTDPFMGVAMWQNFFWLVLNGSLGGGATLSSEKKVTNLGKAS